MSDYTYHDCSLEISNDEDISIEYTDAGKTYVVEGKLSSDPFAYLTVIRLNHWVNYALRMQEQGSKERLYDIEDLQVIGLNLYSILFADDKIREKFNETYQNFVKEYEESKREKPEEDPPLRMRLKLIFKKPAESLGRLPWEFLFIPPGKDRDMDDGVFFSGQKTELILTRFVPDLKLPYEIKQEKLRILIVVSRAEVGMGRIEEKETEELVQQIQGIPKAELTVLSDPTYTTLSQHIETDIKPHILHFIGHGKPGELAIFKDPHEDDYDFDEDEPQVRWISSQQFRALFNRHKPRLIFLHACKGAAPDSNEGFNSTARDLVYADIPAVVAMQYNISNRDAGVFARKFYEELGKGSDIDEAVKAGRMELGNVFPRWEHPRFGTPVVYLQTEKAIVMSAPDEPKPVVEEVVAEPTPAAESAVAGMVTTGRSAAAGLSEGLADRTASAPAKSDAGTDR